MSLVIDSGLEPNAPYEARIRVPGARRSTPTPRILLERARNPQLMDPSVGDVQLAELTLKEQEKIIAQDLREKAERRTLTLMAEAHSLLDATKQVKPASLSRLEAFAHLDLMTKDLILEYMALGMFPAEIAYRNDIRQLDMRAWMDENLQQHELISAKRSAAEFGLTKANAVLATMTTSRAEQAAMKEFISLTKWTVERMNTAEWGPPQTDSGVGAGGVTFVINGDVKGLPEGMVLRNPKVIDHE